METIRIDENRVKIMLTREERIRCGMDDRPERTESETKRAIRRLLADAGIGFDVGRGDISVQLYESRTGGCELFVTRLDGEKTAPDAVTVRLPDLRALTGLCRYLERGGLLAAARLYYDDGWAFCLPAEGARAACEFGSPVGEEETARIREYAAASLSGEALAFLSRDETQKGPEPDAAPIP